MRKISWPEDKRFAFTIVDDTDNATLENISPIYDLLFKLGFLTTKTIWVYPSRDRYTGDSLMNADYCNYIKELQGKGFEIALHNVGSGCFSREEIIQGFEIYKEKLGDFPEIHINHANNPDSIYWGKSRFCFPVNRFNSHFNENGQPFSGEINSSEYFWGDICKKRIKFIRNRVFNSIDTLRCDPQMPYRERRKNEFSNFWFSSSDGANVQAFNRLLNREDIDKLERRGGCCIIYTHFTNGFMNESGRIDPEFCRVLEYLSSKNAWFVPAGKILKFLLEEKDGKEYISNGYSAILDFKWVIHRLLRRY